MKENTLTLEELFEGYEGENPQKEIDWGEDVGKERFWEDSIKDVERIIKGELPSKTGREFLEEVRNINDK